VEETRVPEPARFGDDGAAAAETAQTTPKNVLPFVELPQSSEEYEDSGDINPVAAAAGKFAEFGSASEEVIGAGTSGGPRHGAIIQSEVPLEFLRSE